MHTTHSERDGGWSSGDAERFHYITGQYPSSLMRRRTLLIDRLMRELPHKTRAQIVNIITTLMDSICVYSNIDFSYVGLT